ncbi:hypothetical protein EVAR_90007_1 [Eumeta japonica]|uniref:Reverse transcriptase domain-containing protein n=1 Tax=Eumeta variegata TaxID=151549 RepID=A0A4C2AA44_EUMVA|nr:hypothetical protein EVAR_90007_1 [Eumeta japonica]
MSPIMWSTVRRCQLARTRLDVRNAEPCARMTVRRAIPGYRLVRENGVFPVWKSGAACYSQREWRVSDPKAYRPITLLPVLGDPRRFCWSLRDCARHQLETSTAFGTIDFHRAKRYPGGVRDSNGLFYGPQGGVPRWHRSRVEEVHNGVPGLCPGPCVVERAVGRLAAAPFPAGVKTVAYADDVTVLVEASSRAEIERRAGCRDRRSSGWVATLSGPFPRPLCWVWSWTSTSRNMRKVLAKGVEELRQGVECRPHRGNEVLFPQDNLFSDIPDYPDVRGGVLVRACKSRSTQCPAMSTEASLGVTDQGLQDREHGGLPFLPGCCRLTWSVCLCGQTDEDMRFVSCPLKRLKERHVERNKGAASGPGILCGSRGYTGELPTVCRVRVLGTDYVADKVASSAKKKKPEEEELLGNGVRIWVYKPY